MTTPVVANAAGVPVVNWAHSVEDDLGTLEVSAAAEAGVVGLVAHIQSYATGQDVAVVDDFVLVSGTVQDGVWRTPEPIQLDQLGGYQVVVDVTDGAGNTASGPDFGSLAYLVRTSFSPLQVTPQTVTYTERSVQVTGTLTGKMPANREIVPVPGVTVYVSSIVAEGQPVPATTAPDGSFTATLTMTGPGDVRAEYGGGDPGYLRANADAVEVSVSPAESKVTVTASATEVDFGDSVTLSGQMTWLSPQGWQPLANKQFGVLFCVSDDYCPSSEHPTTDADGRYEVTLAPWQTGHFIVAFPSYDPFIANARTRVDIVVWQPAEFSDFTAARDESGAVVAQGHMQFGNFTPWPIPVQIQYKAPRARTWTTVATVENADWDGTGYAFSAAVTQPKKGHWRAFFAGRPNMYRPVATAPVFVA